MSDQVSDTGIIAQIDGNYATIAIEANNSCKNCGIRFLCSPGSDKEKTIILENTIGAKVGDRVTVSETSNILLKLSFLQYGLPLIGFLLGIVFGIQIQIQRRPVEFYQFLCGLLGLGLAGLISYMIIKHMAKKPGKFVKFKKI
ncbi:MAG: SoxR reducing system RseC family protein [Candidatus Marinimicrobia bacterium]|nr:SoxR reducing system RseC family protein [Candidatus Neomarinimicrobiota bacterium]